MATMKRCRAELSVTVAGRTEHFWVGLQVNLDRELAPGFAIRDAIVGREDCFEDLDEAPPADTALVGSESEADVAPTTKKKAKE